MIVKLGISKIFLQSGETALHLAIANDRVDAVLFLLNNGADPTLKLKVWQPHCKVKFITLGWKKMQGTGTREMQELVCQFDSNEGCDHWKREHWQNSTCQTDSQGVGVCKFVESSILGNWMERIN